MKVRVKAYGGLNQYMPDQLEEMDVVVEEGTTANALVERLGIPRMEIWMISVNKELVKGDVPLKDGDQVLVFAPVAGG